MIYFDTAATSYHKPPQTASAVYNALLGTGSSGRGEHGASLDASRLLFSLRKEVSEFFNLQNPLGVVFTCNSTGSLNIAIQGLLKPGDHCISSKLEHNSVLRPLYYMEKQGAEVTFLDDDNFEEHIKENTKAVVFQHASNVTGNVRDIRRIGEICKKHNILFILDAAQSAGLIPIDMKENNISVLCASGHKGLLGPQGTGVMCLSPGVSPEPLKYGGSGVESFSKDMPQALPERLEAGTLNAHGLAGLKASLEYIKETGQENILNQANNLAEIFYQGIKDIPGIKFYGDYKSNLRIPIVSFNIRDIFAGEIADELFERFAIAVRAGTHCAPGVHEHFGTTEQGIVRFSFSHFNTEDEVLEGIRAVRILEEECR